MAGIDRPGFGGEAQRLRRDLQELRGIAQIEPRLSATFVGLEDWDAIAGAQGRDALAGPPMAVTGLETIAVENARNQIVVGDQGQPTHGFDNIG